MCLAVLLFMAIDLAYLVSRVGKGILRDDLAASYPDFINEALIEIQNRRSFTMMKNTTFVSVQPGILTAGGNLVTSGSVWPTGAGTLTFSVPGFIVGGRYYFNQGNASGISADGTNPITTKDGYFTATQVSYTLLAPASASATLITAAVITAGLDQVAVLPAAFKELQKWRPVHYVTDDGQFIPTDVVFEHQQIFRVWAFGGTPITTWPPRAYLERRGNGETVLGILEPLTSQFNFRVQYYQYLPPLVEDSDVNAIAAAYPEMVIALAKSIGLSSINDPASEEFTAQFEQKFLAASRQDAYSEDRGRELRM